MSLLPQTGDELAPLHRHCRGGDDDSLLPNEDPLTTDSEVASVRITREFKRSIISMSNHLITETDDTTDNKASATMSEDQWPGIDSRYRLIIVAALRSKQLQHGASSRIAADPRKHRSTSIALEEVKRGLVHFTITDENKRAMAMRTGSRAD